MTQFGEIGHRSLGLSPNSLCRGDASSLSLLLKSWPLFIGENYDAIFDFASGLRFWRVFGHFFNLGFVLGSRSI